MAAADCVMGSMREPWGRAVAEKTACEAGSGMFKSVGMGSGSRTVREFARELREARKDQTFRELFGRGVGQVLHGLVPCARKGRERGRRE